MSDVAIATAAAAAAAAADDDATTDATAAVAPAAAAGTAATETAAAAAATAVAAAAAANVAYDHSKPWNLVRCVGLIANAVVLCCVGCKHRPGRKRRRSENASPPRTEPSHSQSTQGLLLIVFGIHGVCLLYWLASCNHFANDDTKHSMSEQCYFPPSNENPVMAYVYSQSTKNLHARTTYA